MPSSPHSALLITPSIIHHLSYHIQKLCPCHKGYAQSLNPVLQNSCKGKGKRVEWTIGRFLSLFCATVYDLILHISTQAMTLQDLYLFFCTSLITRVHSAGWDGCSGAVQQWAAHTKIAPTSLAGVSGEGKPCVTQSPAAPAVSGCDGHSRPCARGCLCAQLYFSSQHWRHSLNRTLRVGDLSLSKTVTYK